MFDVVVIGAGASGSAVAMELAKYKLNVAVVEKENDVCCGTSKANSAIVHAGFDAEHGTLMAKLNVEGSKQMEALSKQLDFPYERNGAFVTAIDEEGAKKIDGLYANGLKNGVEGMSIISGDEARALEPNLSEKVIKALYITTSAIVCPFLMTTAFAEVAKDNGVEFFLGEEVTDIKKNADATYEIKTNKGTYATRLVVNAAGVYADQMHNMVSDHKLSIIPRRGQYMLLDHSAAGLVSRTIFQAPTAMGKGILVSPTVHGNILVGPTAENIEDKEGTNTTADGFAVLKEKAADSVDNIPYGQVITSFAGLRAQEAKGDFTIEEVADAKNFIDVAGICSPGLSSAPAIGQMVADLVAGILHPEMNPTYKKERKGTPHFKELSEEEQMALIKKDATYANVICRCEMITEGEILDSIHRTLGATTLDGVKRRVRAGMGRCQSGFCSPKVMEILERELNLSSGEIKKSADGSEFVIGENKKINGKEA